MGLGNMHFCYYLNHSDGSRMRAQKLGEMEGERNECYFRVGERCAELSR